MSDSDTLSQRASSVVLRYGLAVSSVAVALIFTLLLRPDVLVSTVFFLAIMLSAWFGGIGPGLVAALLATMAITYFFLVPLYSFRFDPSHAPHLLVFFLSALLVSSWGAVRRRAETLLRRARDEMEAKVQERTADLRQSNEELQAEIAERKRAEEALQKQALELQDQAQLLELAHDAILVRNLASEIIFWNRGAERMYGWLREEAHGQITHGFLQTAFPTSFEEVQANLLGVGYWEGELLHTMRDGSRLVVASRQVLQRDKSGNPVAILEINSDITERKRAEEAVREQASLLNLTHDTIFARGMNDAITYWNRGAEELYGWKKEEAIGRISHDLMQTIFPARLEEIYEELLRSGHWEGELIHTKRDGTKVVVASRWALQRDEQGNSLAILETNNDVTERKQAGDELQKAQSELAHATRVMTMGELAASIAHEVNQPLGAIVTNGHACVRLLSHAAPDLEKSREVIERMIKDGMRASEVIRRIRDLLHKAPPKKAPLNINDAIQEVIALVSSDVLRSNVELKAELAADPPAVVGDRIQLQQVILNLILNGKDAMSSVKTRPRELLITSREGNAGELLVAVRDTGNGLDPQNVERIFDPFFTTKPEGMGLGLSISRTIIEAHGGRLWATQNEDNGATIQFTLHPGSGIEL
ncbi:MAG TPA: PAS domain S-box protein [Pyrinomonadaceae bacterium]|nr:PAS domain S-box protein [Pyrinomonadaceae bacterium]